MRIDGLDHQVGNPVTLIVPMHAIRERGRDVLAKQAGDVLSGRRERVIQRGRNQHFDDRLPCPALGSCIEISLFHVTQRRRNDDAGAVVFGRLTARQAAKIRQLRQRDVHTERTGTTAPLTHASGEFCGQGCGVDQRFKQ